MENIWIKAVAFCVISLAATSCSRSFEEINTDTSKIIEPTPASLLAPIQYNMAANAYLRANDFTFDIMQIAIDFPGEGNNISRYYVTEVTVAQLFFLENSFPKHEISTSLEAILERFFFSCSSKF